MYATNAALAMEMTPIVFIVDDDAAVLAALTLLVRSCGWEARPFESAEAFLTGFDARGGEWNESVDGPACLLLDLQMPGMTGPELQARLGGEGIDLPVIVVTAHSDHALAERARAAGARAVIGKPFHHDDLVAEIERALGSG